MSRWYFDGWVAGLIALISLLFVVAIIPSRFLSRLSGPGSGCSCLRFVRNLAKVRPGAAGLEAERPSDFTQSFLVFSREFAPRAQNVNDNTVCLFPGLRVGRVCLMRVFPIFDKALTWFDIRGLA